MKFKRIITAVMTATMMFSALSVNAGAVSAQPEAHISSTGAVYHNEDVSTDVEIISSRIVEKENKNCNTICLNVGAKVYLGNIFKLADGYDFDDFTYECTDSQGDDLGEIKIVKSSGKYYLKAIDEGILNYIRVFYKKRLIATVCVNVSNDYKSASKVTVSTKTPKIGQEITLKALTSNNKYATCCWIIVGDSSWELPAAWYANWNTDKDKRSLHRNPKYDKTAWGKATLSFNDFGKVKIYCLSPNGKLKKVKINISEEVYDTSINYPDKTWFYDTYYFNEKGESGKAVGYVKPDGTVVFTVKSYKNGAGIGYYEKDYDLNNFAYSWEKGYFYEVCNKGTSWEYIHWLDQSRPRFSFKAE